MAARFVRFLLVARPAAIPEDELFAAFWPELEAASARRSLHVVATRARAVLDHPGRGESALDVRDRTYRLVLGGDDHVDVDEFEAAAAAALAGHGPGRRRLLERARGLWGGEPLPEDRYADWTIAWRERLVDRYGEVVEALAAEYAAAGHAAAAVDAARILVELDPLNERAHRELMAAYARAGRTSHALRQFLACRRLLVDKLGVEPSGETARLQQRILAGEPV
jgi:DNA-binding SARP family transcriptional activator